MTAILEKAFAHAAKLPKSAQKQLAAQLLADIEGELKWDEMLRASQPLLEKLVEKARVARKHGRTVRKGFDQL